MNQTHQVVFILNADDSVCYRLIYHYIVERPYSSRVASHVPRCCAFPDRNIIQCRAYESLKSFLVRNGQRASADLQERWRLFHFRTNSSVRLFAEPPSSSIHCRYSCLQCPYSSSGIHGSFLSPSLSQ